MARKVYKNLSGTFIGLDLFGVGKVEIPAHAVAIELDSSVADVINSMSKPTIVLEEVDNTKTPEDFIVTKDEAAEVEFTIPSFEDEEFTIEGEDLGKVTKAVIKELLDEKGIAYSRDTTKDQLIALLEGADING